MFSNDILFNFSFFPGKKSPTMLQDIQFKRLIHVSKRNNFYFTTSTCIRYQRVANEQHTFYIELKEKSYFFSRKYINCFISNFIHSSSWLCAIYTHTWGTYRQDNLGLLSPFLLICTDSPDTDWVSLLWTIQYWVLFTLIVLWWSSQHILTDLEAVGEQRFIYRSPSSTQKSLVVIEL